MLSNEFDNDLAFDSQILEAGEYFEGPHDHPEALPIHVTSAHNVEDLDALLKRYKDKGYCYNRNGNPNRDALGKIMSTVEGGKASMGFNCGMAAIATTLITNTKAGDHVLSDKTLYGEAIEIFTDILKAYDVDYDFVDFTDLKAVKAAVKPNTVLLYTEIESNPLITLPDIRALADIAHENKAILIVDNTFMTGALVRPLSLGADIVVNSLTKFANGHSDSLCGAVTSNDEEMIKKIRHRMILLGNEANVFDSWLSCRGIRTLDLRIHKASDNALALAKALEKNPYVKRVFYTGLESNKYHELAIKEFGGKYFGGMLTIELEENLDKMNKFIRSLKIVHYAMTLGGYRTTMSYPPFSSHDNLTREERLELGITDGMIRISVGIENPRDLIKDFEQALEAAYKD